MRHGTQGTDTNISANDSAAFRWKLCSYWLEGLRQRHVARKTVSWPDFDLLLSEPLWGSISVSFFLYFLFFTGIQIRCKIVIALNQLLSI